MPDPSEPMPSDESPVDRSAERPAERPAAASGGTSGDTGPLPTTPEQLFARLSALEIAVQTHHHAAVFTVEEARTLRGTIPGGHCKNLFVRNKKGRQWLLVCEEDTPVDLKQVGTVLDAGRLSFGSPDRLRRVLGVAPGSVTPFALINDTGLEVTPILDARMMRHGLLNYHPLVNTMTCTITREDLTRFIAACGHTPHILDLNPAE